MLRRRGQRGSTIPSQRHLVASRAKVDAQGLPQTGLILDHEDACHAASGSPDRRLREGQANSHRQAPARRVVGDHRAAHRLDESTSDGEAQSNSLGPMVVQALKRLEQLRLLLVGNPGAVIDHLELRSIRPGMSDHLHPTVITTVSERVVEHIDEHALKQARIRVYEWQVLRNVDLYPARSDRATRAER